MASVIIHEGVTSIGKNAFFRCEELTSVTIPGSVTSIGDGAFFLCTDLTSVTIPESVTYIGKNAFYGCTKLISVYYAASDPIEGDSAIFFSEDENNNIYDKATLYVPAEAVEKCKQIDPWKNFTKIEAYDFSRIEEVIADFNADEPYEVFNLNGVKAGDSLNSLAPGLYIIRQGNTVKKIAVK